MQLNSLKGLDYLHSLPAWRGQNGFDLTNIKKLLSYLDNPQDKVKCIHIAGTNGKGSCAVAIASILAQSGAKVGLTTSPHLSHLTERIVLDGYPIESDLLGNIALEIKRVSEQYKIELSFFEAITAVAFLSFYEQKLDWAVIETGLGGRLDATNVIKKPEACVLTSISLDHEKILGSDLSLIAREKAHIAKMGVPFICGPLTEDEHREVQFVCTSYKAKLYAMGRDFQFKKQPMLPSGHFPFKFIFHDLLEGTFCSSLRGQHQCNNAALAVATTALLGSSIEYIERGLSNFFWPGRLEQITCGFGELLLDAAHNTEGAEALSNYLKSLHLFNLECVFGVLDTKNWKSMISVLSPHVNKWLIVSPDSPNALNIKEIATYLSSNEVNFKIYGTDYQALFQYLHSGLRALHRASQPLLVTGSIYMLGKFRDLLVSDSRALWQPVLPSLAANI